ncbi:MAG TPA: tyrosine--tRNA ligase, partial [Bacteroidetes bacterium]|nr:tyrosine--tRNA ligase [Bacteroidota bacterium]
MSKTNTNPDKIQALLSRGVEKIYPNKDYLEKLLSSGKQLSLYLGIDPTGNSLHLGHAIILEKLHQFQELGHKITLLIGNFTATI